MFAMSRTKLVVSLSLLVGCGVTGAGDDGDDTMGPEDPGGSRPPVTDTGTSTLAGIAAFVEDTMNLADDRVAPEQLQGAIVSANAFGLIGDQPIAGRAFIPADDAPGAAPVVKLGYRVWQSTDVVAWTPVETSEPLDGDIALPAEAGAQRYFYRLEILEPTD